MKIETPPCGPQIAPERPGDPFEWEVLAGIGAGAVVLAYIYEKGIPIITKLAGALTPSIGLTASAAGALAILTLVGYYLLRPDGCIRDKPQSQAVCCSGIVEQVTDQRSTATFILAPYAIGPSYVFDVVVKHTYLYLIYQGAHFVNCSAEEVPLLRCVVKSEVSCGARIGSAIGATAGAVGGTILGYMAGAAIASLGCGPLAWLCAIAALIVAAIVGAIVTLLGASAGGMIGGGIAAIGEDKVEETAESLKPGTIVTVRGDWTRNPDQGHNELFYVTSLNRTGDFDQHPPPYTIEDADSTPKDDCPISPPVIE